MEMWRDASIRAGLCSNGRMVVALMVKAPAENSVHRDDWECSRARGGGRWGNTLRLQQLGALERDVVDKKDERKPVARHEVPAAVA